MKNLKLGLLLFAVTLFALNCKPTDNPTPTVENGTGLNLNTDDALAKVEEADFDLNGVVLPASFAFDGPPILTQASTSKCVAFSGPYYILSLYNGVTKASPNNDKAASPEFAYANYKKLENGDCNKGCWMFDQGSTKGMATLLQADGTTSWNQMPFVDSKNCSVTNTALDAQAAVNKIGGFAELDAKEYNNINELKAWMYGGYPLWFAVPVDDGYFQKLGTATWTQSSGKTGNHAMTLVGWDDSRKAFKIANSWGENWGDQGYGWVDYDYFKTLISLTKTIGVLFPNDAQKPFFSKLSPGSCGRAGWGSLVVNNKRTEEIAIEISGVKSYNNTTAKNVDASERQFYKRIPTGDIKVKVYNATKTTLIKEYTASVTECNDVVVNVD